jgi:hypothetical protein
MAMCNEHCVLMCVPKDTMRISKISMCYGHYAHQYN